MFLVEPCCAPKHLAALQDGIREKGTAFWHAYGDFSLAEFLPALLLRYCEAEMVFAAPYLPDDAAEALCRAMHSKRARMDGTGSMDTIAHLTLVTDLSGRRSPLASTWLKENPFGERLTIRNVHQADTAVIMPDIAFIGPVNLTYGHHFTAVATKNAGTLESLRSLYVKL